MPRAENSSSRAKFIKWSTDPRPDRKMLEWLETHDRERDVVFGVAKGKDCTRTECADRMASAIVRSGIFKGGNAGDHPVNGSKVMRRLSRVRDKYEELMRNFPRTFITKSGQEMNQQDTAMFEELLVLTKDFVEWRRWHEIFRNLPKQSDTSDTELDATSREDNHLSQITVRTQRTAQKASEASASKKNQSSIRLSRHSVRRKNDFTPETSPGSQISAEGTLPIERVAQPGNTLTRGEGSTSIEDRRIELELLRERNTHEKLLLRKFELEMEERKRRDEYDRERERERHAVGLRFLESGFFSGGTQGKPN